VTSLEFYLWWDGCYYFDDISYIEGEVSRTPPVENSTGTSGQSLGIGFSEGDMDLSVSTAGPNHSPKPDFIPAQTSSSMFNKEDYRPRGTLISSIFDMGMTVYWGITSWSADTPPSTSVRVYVRTGENKNPADGGWSEWYEAQNGSDLPLVGRYVQYMVVLETQDGKVTPVLEDITITYSLQEGSQLDLLLLAVAGAGIGVSMYYIYRRRKRSKMSRYGKPWDAYLVR